MRGLLRILFVVDVFLVNIIVGYMAYQTLLRPKNTGTYQAMPTDTQITAPVNTTIRSYVDQCGTECQKMIDTKLAEAKKELLKALPTPPVVSGNTTMAAPTGKSTKVRREELLTIPGNGNISQNDWTQINSTAFYFDTRDYPGLVEVYFEAKMNLENGNGTAYVRLYDATHGIGVNGSENTTTSQQAVWSKSQKVYFWFGRNLLYVQAKSLTADTVGYFNGQLRLIIYE